VGRRSPHAVASFSFLSSERVPDARQEDDWESGAPAAAEAAPGDYQQAWRPTARGWTTVATDTCGSPRRRGLAAVRRRSWSWTGDGWTWESDEPWAWTFHYGRWALSPVFGWVWFPGTCGASVGGLGFGRRVRRLGSLFPVWRVVVSNFVFVNEANFCDPNLKHASGGNRVPRPVIETRGRATAGPISGTIARVTHHPVRLEGSRTRPWRLDRRGESSSPLRGPPPAGSVAACDRHARRRARVTGRRLGRARSAGPSTHRLGSPSRPAISSRAAVLRRGPSTPVSACRAWPRDADGANGLRTCWWGISAWHGVRLSGADSRARVRGPAARRAPRRHAATVNRSLACAAVVDHATPVASSLMRAAEIATDAHRRGSMPRAHVAGRRRSSPSPSLCKEPRVPHPSRPSSATSAATCTTRSRDHGCELPARQAHPVGHTGQMSRCGRTASSSRPRDTADHARPQVRRAQPHHGPVPSACIFLVDDPYGGSPSCRPDGKQAAEVDKTRRMIEEGTVSVGMNPRAGADGYWLPPRTARRPSTPRLGSTGRIGGTRSRYTSTATGVAREPSTEGPGSGRRRRRARCEGAAPWHPRRCTVRRSSRSRSL